MREPLRSPIRSSNASPVQQDPAYRVRGILIDGFDSTTKSMRTLFPGARVGYCLRHALNKLPGKLMAIPSPCAKPSARSSTRYCIACDSGRACGCLRWANGCAALRTT